MLGENDCRQKKWRAGMTIIAQHPGYPYMFFKAMLIVP
jgi:hypothetical protein|tara:strand:+ start:519 stop:632 length:114 start_codon:yes stop_codon:yes gene_type:complete